MRKQQINLYQPIFKKQSVAFSFTVMLTIVGIAILGMGLLYGFSIWNTEKLKQDYLKAQARYENLEMDVSNMAEKLPVPQVNKLLESELSQLVEKRKTGFALLNTLQTRIAANKEGFSGYFEGLARQSLSEIWFTQITITEAGAHLSLKGKTLKPEWVPLLLKNLQNAPAYTGKSFQVVDVTRQEDNDSQLEFSLMTAVRSKEE
ncbi:MAG: hypothetical protein OQL20_05505 [Sedimenticola sp.]|nr:hypothetical protein [Sedimenticola sp.]